MSIDLPLDSMSAIEKLKVIESVWASLESPPDMPEWHREVLAERKRRLESGETTVSSWEEAKKRFNDLGNDN